MEVIKNPTRRHTSEGEQYFSYSNMSKVKVISETVENYFAYKGFLNSRGFTYLHMAGVQRTQEEKGWKLHISIDTSQIDEAWLVVFRSIRAHGIVVSKIIRREAIDGLNQDLQQKGKVMTIYCFKQEKTPEDWMSFIHEVTRQLRAHHIRPGPVPGAALSGTIEEPEYGGASIIESNYQGSSSDEDSDNDTNDHTIPGTEYFTYKTDFFHDPNPNPLKREGRFVEEREAVIEYRPLP